MVLLHLYVFRKCQTCALVPLHKKLSQQKAALLSVSAHLAGSGHCEWHGEVGLARAHLQLSGQRAQC